MLTEFAIESITCCIPSNNITPGIRQMIRTFNKEVDNNQFVDTDTGINALSKNGYLTVNNMGDGSTGEDNLYITIDKCDGNTIQRFPKKGDIYSEKFENNYVYKTRSGGTIGQNLSKTFNSHKVIIKLFEANEKEAYDFLGELTLLSISKTGVYLAKNPLGNSLYFINVVINPIEMSTDEVRVNTWDYIGWEESWGHASMELGDGTYISWWPVKDNFPSTKEALTDVAMPANNPQPFSRDILLENNKVPNKTVSIRGLNMKLMIEYWNSFRNNPANEWSAISQNCSTVVKNVLLAGEAMEKLSPTQQLYYKSIMVWRPKYVYELATDLSNI